MLPGLSVGSQLDREESLPIRRLPASLRLDQLTQLEKIRGFPKNSELGRTLRSEKPWARQRNGLPAERIAEHEQPNHSGLRPRSLRSLTCPIMACSSSRSGIPRITSMAREGFQTRMPARCFMSTSKNSIRIETARSIRLSGPWAGSILIAISLITSGSKSVNLQILQESLPATDRGTRYV